MKRLVLISLLLLTACEEEVAQSTDPVALGPDTIGHFCQMNLTEHPGPKAQAHLDGLPGAPLFFSQVRDAIAYARLPERDHRILAIWVSDMGAPGATWDNPGADNWTEAASATYVMGSSLMGGMGAPDVIPFADPAKARSFAARFGGRVLSLDDIPDRAVLPPDQSPASDDDPAFDARLRALSKTQAGG